MQNSSSGSPQCGRPHVSKTTAAMAAGEDRDGGGNDDESSNQTSRGSANLEAKARMANRPRAPSSEANCQRADAPANAASPPASAHTTSLAATPPPGGRSDRNANLSGSSAEVAQHGTLPRPTRRAAKRNLWVKLDECPGDGRRGRKRGQATSQSPRTESPEEQRTPNRISARNVNDQRGSSSQIVGGTPRLGHSKTTARDGTVSVSMGAGGGKGTKSQSGGAAGGQRPKSQGVLSSQGAQKGSDSVKRDHSTALSLAASRLSDHSTSYSAEDARREASSHPVVDVAELHPFGRVIVMTLEEWVLLQKSVLEQIGIQDGPITRVKVDWLNIAERLKKPKAVCEFVWWNFELRHYRPSLGRIVMQWNPSAQPLQPKDSRVENVISAFCESTRQRMVKLLEFMEGDTAAATAAANHGRRGVAESGGRNTSNRRDAEQKSPKRSKHEMNGSTTGGDHESGRRAANKRTRVLQSTATSSSVNNAMGAPDSGEMSKSRAAARVVSYGGVGYAPYAGGVLPARPGLPQPYPAAYLNSFGGPVVDPSFLPHNSLQFGIGGGAPYHALGRMAGQVPYTSAMALSMSAVPQRAYHHLGMFGGMPNTSSLFSPNEPQMGRPLHGVSAENGRPVFLTGSMPPSLVHSASYVIPPTNPSDPSAVPSTFLAAYPSSGAAGMFPCDGSGRVGVPPATTESLESLPRENHSAQFPFPSMAAPQRCPTQIRSPFVPKRWVSRVSFSHPASNGMVFADFGSGIPSEQQVQQLAPSGGQQQSFSDGS